MKGLIFNKFIRYMATYAKLSPSTKSRRKKRFRRILVWAVILFTITVGIGFWLFHQHEQILSTNFKLNKKLKFVPAAHLPIRAAFFDPTDHESYLSLKTNISKLNLLITEFMFIKPGPDTVFVQGNFRGETSIRAAGVKTLAMLSNYYGDDFKGDIVHRIFNEPKKRIKLINDVIKIIQQNHFAGVNIDIEEMIEDSDEPFIVFVQQLYAKMHPLGLIVSIDISPFNKDFNLAKLAGVSDYLFLMAYDEYNNDTGPGPVSSTSYIKSSFKDAAIQLSARQIASQLILCIAGYGYDWPLHQKARTISCEQALKMVRNSECKIDTGHKRHNLDCTYTDAKGVRHMIYFTNANTNLTTMKFAAEKQMAGVALWRLGLEDHRLWEVYDKKFTKFL